MSDSAFVGCESNGVDDHLVASRPIPIFSRSRHGDSLTTHSPLSHSCPVSAQLNFEESIPPRAPVIGSLPPPQLEHSPMPPLSLPPPTPESDIALGSNFGSTPKHNASVFNFGSPFSSHLQHTRGHRIASDSIALKNISSDEFRRRSGSPEGLSNSLTALSILQGSLGPLEKQSLIGERKKDGTVGYEFDEISQRWMSRTRGFSDDDLMMSVGDDHDEATTVDLFHFEEN